MDLDSAHAKSLTKEAAGSYPAPKRSSEALVVRWEWATASMYSHEPCYFEIAGVTKGMLLPSTPHSPLPGVHSYGFDRQQRIVLESVAGCVNPPNSGAASWL
jgi:hypothetical protein